MKKLLSLLMVLAILCTMVPAAFAMNASDFSDWDDWDAWEDYIYEYELDDLTTSMLKNITIDWDEDECEELGEDHVTKLKNDEDEIIEIIDWEDVEYYTLLTGDYNYDEDDLEDYFYPPTCGDDNEGVIGVACTECGAWGAIALPDLHDWDDEPLDWDDEDHELECLECGETDWFEHDDDCDCLDDVDDDDDDDDDDYPEYVYVSDADSKLILTVDDDTDNGLYAADEEDLYVYLEVEVDDSVTDYEDYTFEFDWSGDYDGDPDDDDYESEVMVDTTGTTAEITCLVTATKGESTLEGEVTWSLKAESDIVVDVVVYNDVDSFLFDEMDEEGNDSVADQIIAGLEDLDEDYVLQYVEFDSVKATGKGELDAKTTKKYYDENADDYDSKDLLLSEVEFVPDADYEGTVSFDIVVTYLNAKDKKKEASGTINIEVKEGGTGLGIVLTVESGDEVVIDEDLFYDFWEEKYEDGLLEKVKFNSVSKGTLYYDYDGDDEAKLSGKTCYVDPSSKQIALEELTYVPAKSTTSAVIDFTATGENHKGKETSASGTITILLTDGAVNPIVYEHTGSNITLDADDFTDLYKDVMDVSKVSNLQIQFLEAPESGTLYANYNAKTGKGTALTERTIGTYKFNTTAIEKVVYDSSTGTAGDTLQFACYSGNTLKFLGTVEFGKADPIVLTKIGSTNGVTFTASDFFSSSNADLMRASYITFGTPASGALYMNYNGTTGTKVVGAMKFASFDAAALGYYNISKVTFVPAAGGKATVPFTATLYNNKTVSGVVEITTIVNRFPDLKYAEYSWAFDHIMKLVGMGVVNGDDKGNVNPGGDITYGEVLKIVMKAAGYADQPATGTHWASGYLSRAVVDGLISANTDLNAKADRNAVATLTGKALKLTQASSVNAGIAAPSDSTNGYVYALYNAGILTGSNVNGVNYFKGSDTITRAEAFTIVSRVYDYAK